MSFTTLISVDELKEHLDAPSVKVFDCRFDLADTAKGESAYREGHIPGAIYAHLDHHLSSPITETTGRHPLPDIHRLVEWLGSCGVDADSQVVVYDDSFGTMATRLWWLLRWLGHDRVALLEGGWQAWQRSGGEYSTEIPATQSVQFNYRIKDELLLHTRDILADMAISEPAWLLIDARLPNATTARQSLSTRWQAVFPARSISPSNSISTKTDAIRPKRNCGSATWILSATIHPDRQPATVARE